MELLGKIALFMCLQIILRDTTTAASTEGMSSTLSFVDTTSKTTSVYTTTSISADNSTLNDMSTTDLANENVTHISTENISSVTGESTKNTSDVTFTQDISSTTITMENTTSTLYLTNTTEDNTTAEQSTEAESTIITTSIPSKEEGLTLAEKQKRNGLTSAVIIAGSLILIGIAYLSSFVDKPNEKVPTVSQTELNKEKYRYEPPKKIANKQNEGAGPGKEKQIKFSEETQFSQQKPGTSSDINGKPAVAEVQNRKRPNKDGWDVLTQNPKFFDDYQPQHTTTTED